MKYCRKINELSPKVEDARDWQIDWYLTKQGDTEARADPPFYEPLVKNDRGEQTPQKVEMTPERLKPLIRRAWEYPSD